MAGGALCAPIAEVAGQGRPAHNSDGETSGTMALLANWRKGHFWGSKKDPAALARKLAEQESLSKLLQDTADIVVFTQDRDGRVLSVNRHGRWLAGIPENLGDESFLSLLHNPPADLTLRLQELREGRRNNFRHETPLLRPNAEPLLLAWWHVPWRLGDSDDQRLVSIGLDISDQRLAEEHLSWLALHDPLTGLLNRRGFLERARALVASQKEFALMLLDLDQFKDINDLRGHHEGDRLLQKVSKALRTQLRQSDIIARLGGDEFGILLPDTEPEHVEIAANRACEALRTIAPMADSPINVTTSIGVVLFPDHGADVDSLLANADIALYQAKSSGRNAWHLFDGGDAHRARIHERVYWERQVRSVLDSDNLEMHFQPILDLSSNTVTHHEALLRSRGENGDFLRTDLLIIAAEQNGHIHRLDELVIRKVFGHLAELSSQGIQTRLALNLSGLSFNNPNLVPYIHALIHEYSIDPGSIIFEITETAALADIESSIQTMEALRAEGCHFALDDFGVGFSSLYYLKKLPVDYIKIDGSFIRNLSQDKEHQVLIRALVNVAEAFKLRTIAEFVEDEQVMSLLSELGVNYAQGYHIDKPKPFAEVWSPQ